MKRDLTIAGKKIGEDCPVYVIAEMSANHLQDFERAKKIIVAAAKVGADAVKLQTYRPDTITLNCHNDEFLATPGSPWEGQNLYDLYKTAYTPWDWQPKLKDYAESLGITLFSSPFDATAVDFLEDMDVPAYKIASFEITDIPLIRKVAATGKPIILSTGIATLSDIELAVNTCIECENDKIILLKCVSEYPTPYQDINLRTIPNMKDVFGCNVGISDHSFGTSVAIAAIAMGACVVEKHLTLSRSEGGPDAMFSMEPDEFGRMVEEIKNVKLAMGEVSYKLTAKQAKSRKRGRSLYVSADIPKGKVLNENNVKSVRPGYGLHPKHYDEILGKRAKQDLKMGMALRWEYLE